MPHPNVGLRIELLDALRAAEEALITATRVLGAMGADVSEDTRLLRIRRIREDIGELEDRITSDD